MTKKRKMLFFLALAALVILGNLTAAAAMPRVVAVAGEEPEKYDLYLMDLDGKNRVKLYAAESSYLEIYYVSPDGATVYFCNGGRNQQIGLDGKNLGLMMLYGLNPQPSPDGTKVVYTSYDPDTFNYCVFMADPYGNGEIQLTQRTEKETEIETEIDETEIDYIAINDETPSWSPDGKKIVFTRKKIAFLGGDYMDKEIYVFDLQTGAVTAITDDGNTKRSLLWTPDGKKLVYAYASFWEDTSDFYWIDPDGNNKEKLTKGDMYYYQLVWLPPSVAN